jgi:hypothetical protein
MPNIPFSAQILPTNYLTAVQVYIRDGNLVSGEDLLLAFDCGASRSRFTCNNDCDCPSSARSHV